MNVPPGMRKACFPISHGLVGEFKAADPKEFCDLSVAQLVADSTQQDLEDDISRKFQKIEGSAGAFIQRAMTILAVEDRISEGCRALQLGDSVGAAVRTGHQTVLRFR